MRDDDDDDDDEIQGQHLLANKRYRNVTICSGTCSHFERHHF